MSGVVAVVVAVVVVAVVMSSSSHAGSLGSTRIRPNLLKTAAPGTPIPTTPPTPGPAGPEGRIIGGAAVTDRCEAPFSAMVALQLFPEYPQYRLTHCSAVMLSADVLLTAAGCMTPYFSFPISELNVVLGEKHIDFRDWFQTTAHLESFKIHPGYNNATGDNDLALIKLRSPATLNACVQPLPLYEKEHVRCDSALMNCTVTGWGPFGRFGDLHRNSKMPRYGHIRLADEQLSQMLAGSTAFPDMELKPNSLVALPFPDWNIQTCFLDWGGMVACQTEGTWKLRGIISDQNCFPRNTTDPMIFTNVENFRSWIDACVNDFNSPDCQALPAP